MQCLSAPNSRASRKQSELGYRVQRGMSMGVEWQWFIVCTVDGFEMEMSLMSFFSKLYVDELGAMSVYCLFFI